MTNPYTFTHNAMEVGVAACNPDTTDANIEHLKWEVDNLGSSIPTGTIIDLGTISSGTITLTVDKFHKVTFSGASTIALPTSLTSGVHYNCSLLVTMSSAVTITQPTVTWANASTPTLTSTTAKYRLTYETIDGGATWYGYWTTLGS